MRDGRVSGPGDGTAYGAVHGAGYGAPRQAGTGGPGPSGVRGRERYGGAGARRRGVLTAVALAGCGALLAAGCSPAGGPGAGIEGFPSAAATAGSAPAAPPDAPAASPGPPPPAKGSVTVTGEIAKGLEAPWGVAVLPDGNLLVASRDKGTIHRIEVATGRVTQIGEVPGVAPGGEGGLLGLALSPSFASDRQVYAYFTTVSDNRIARLRYDDRRAPGQQLGAPDTVFRGIPEGLRPQRRPDRLRPGQDALRGDGRHR